MRLSGTLRSWHDDRGFGFIAPTHGGAEVFVHISALPRDGTRPTVGEKLTYELTRGKHGKPEAHNVLRQALSETSRRSAPRTSEAKQGGATAAKTLCAVVVLALGAYGYNLHRPRAVPTANTAGPVAGGPAATRQSLVGQANISCDGRTHCSQMTSCAEATYFLKNCPGAEMDGDNDGVPCEQQWCASPLSE